MSANTLNTRRIGMATLTLGFLALTAVTQAGWPLDERITAGTNGADNDRFGYGVAISGEYVIVGAYFDDDNQQTDSGSAYIFKWGGSSWSPYQAKITAGSNAEANAWFGSVVSIDGDYAIVGADHEDAGSLTDSGAAYIFVRNSTSWSRQVRLTAAANGEAEAYFGCSVDISGNYAIVGAHHETVSGMSSTGAAYIFMRSGTSWSRQARITAGSDAAADDRFGAGVSIYGDYVVVGAPCNDDTAQNSGSAYVFQRSGTSWNQVAKLTASDAGFYDQFAESVSISGDCVVVGSLSDDWGDMSGAGSAYIFEQPSGGWANMTETAKLTASDAEAYDYMGMSVDISGDYAIVSSHEEDTNGTQSGSAYIFEKPSSGWANMTETAKVTAGSDGDDYDYFGWSVGIDGTFAVVGSPYDYDNHGSAFIYERSGSGSDCPGDLDGDGDIDLSDLAALLAAYGTVAGDTNYNPDADLDADGDVDLSDLAALLAVYGTTCPEDQDTLIIRILTDSYALETTWDLYEQGGGLIASGDPDENNTLFEWEVGLDPESCYDFTIYDSYGDGICCAYGEGFYELELNGELVAANYNFDGTSDTAAVGGGCEEILGACCVGGECVDTVPFEVCESLFGEWYPGEDCFGNPPFECPGGVENDDCIDALPIEELIELPFDTSMATFDGEGQCMSGPNIWYCFTAPVDGMVYIGTCGSGYDTKLAVYDGCGCDPAPPIMGCNDDSCDLQSEIMLPTVAGQQYLIEVGGFSDASGPGVLTVMYQ